MWCSTSLSKILFPDLVSRSGLQNAAGALTLLRSQKAAPHTTE